MAKDEALREWTIIVKLTGNKAMLKTTAPTLLKAVANIKYRVSQGDGWTPLGIVGRHAYLKWRDQIVYEPA